MAGHGEVAIVTGGGRVVGRAMALGFSRAGFRVATTAARTRDEFEALAKEAPEGRQSPSQRGRGQGLRAGTMARSKDRIKPEASYCPGLRGTC